MRERNPHPKETEATLAGYQRLKEENAALRRLLADNGITIPLQPASSPPPLEKPDAPDAGVNEHSSKEAKVALFRSLFRGREMTAPSLKPSVQISRGFRAASRLETFGHSSVGQGFIVFLVAAPSFWRFR
jgi:hypothetical protein